MNVSSRSNQIDENASSETMDRQTCPLNSYDCKNKQFNKTSSEEHYRSQSHQTSLVKRAEQLVEDMKQMLDHNDIILNTFIEKLGKLYELLAVIVKQLDGIRKDVTQIDFQTSLLKRQIREFSLSVEDLQAKVLQEKAYSEIITLSSKVDEQNFRSYIEAKENEIKLLEPDGTIIWRITNVGEKFYDAQSERQTSIFSPPFYTSKTGYKASVRLYLNGDGTARGTHMSIFIVILHGEFDSILTWPFSYRISFCLYDQRTIMETNGKTEPKHNIQSFRPDTTSTSFHRPKLSMNIASGIPKFFPLDQFIVPSNQNLYLVNDTMFIHTYIDFVGLPRPIVPFIFNLNVALPTHIREKLIRDEMQRRGLTLIE